MAVANRDVISILKKAEAALVDRDGYAGPPDGGLYEEKTDGDNFWFVCCICDGRAAGYQRCCSDGHTGALRLLLERISRHARAGAFAAAPLAAVPPAEAEATTVARPRLAPPPPPPHEPFGFASSPASFDKQEKHINELSDRMAAMNTKVVHSRSPCAGCLQVLNRHAIVRRRLQRHRIRRRLQRAASRAGGGWSILGKDIDGRIVVGGCSDAGGEWAQWAAAASTATS